jgi:2-polyprenyl-6-hydroxyphenyl methylase / 3-demethylubiquinone-9 3-methyltransferase
MASKPAHPATSTIKPEEAKHFGAHAAAWWDPKGSSAMLHKLNPVRLGYIRNAIDAHWDADPRALRPLAGKRAIDVGCGAGLLCEPLARMGAQVTGLDAAPENIAAAQAHATRQRLEIDYQVRGVETMDCPPFDLVTSMEVIEHVADPALFVRSLAKMLAPNGLMIVSTPNRTAASRLGMITLGEGMGHIPKGTHDWNAFLTPEELTVLLNDAGLRVTHMQGISFTIGKGLTLSDNIAFNYIMQVRHAAK